MDMGDMWMFDPGSPNDQKPKGPIKWADGIVLVCAYLPFAICAVLVVITILMYGVD